MTYRGKTIHLLFPMVIISTVQAAGNACTHTKQARFCSYWSCFLRKMRTLLTCPQWHRFFPFLELYKWTRIPFEH